MTPRQFMSLNNAQGGGSTFPSPSFVVPFTDSGAGAVNTAPSVGSGSATFTRATSATTINSTGIVTTVGVNVARSFYDPTTLVYQGYLSELAATNLCLQSQDQTSVTWVKTNLTVTTLDTDPANTTTANRCVPTAANAVHNSVQVFVKAASAIAYSFSVWGKANGYNFLGVRADDALGNGAFACFNVSTGAVSTAITGIGVAFTALSTAVKQYPNGWYRCTISFTSNTAVALDIVLGAQNATGDPTVVTFVGDTTSGIDVWGAQLEAATFPTTYISTTTVTVTRNADQLMYPATNNIADAAGTAFAQVVPYSLAAGSVDQVVIGDSVSNTSIINSLNITTVRFFDNTNIDDFATAGRSNGTSYKHVTTWLTGTGVNMYFNGALLAGGPKAYDNTLNMNNITIGEGAGTKQLNGTIASVKIYPSVLTAAQIATF